MTNYNYKIEKNIETALNFFKKNPSLNSPSLNGLDRIKIKNYFLYKYNVRK